MAAVEAGATALGFMFAPSRRQVTAADVRSILQQLPAHRTVAVGVFVNETPRAMAGIVEDASLDVVQLSGDEPPSVLDEIEVATWKALRFDSHTTLDEARRTVEPWIAHAHPVHAVLIDAATPGVYGGSGHIANWELAGLLAERYPVVLAGGLAPGNVADAIRDVRPSGVDVSSGVEIDNAKSPDRIWQFVRTAREAFDSPVR